MDKEGKEIESNQNILWIFFFFGLFFTKISNKFHYKMSISNHTADQVLPPLPTEKLTYMLAK